MSRCVRPKGLCNTRYSLFLFTFITPITRQKCGNNPKHFPLNGAAIRTPFLIIPKTVHPHNNKISSCLLTGMTQEAPNLPIDPEKTGVFCSSFLARDLPLYLVTCQVADRPGMAQ
ncbi:hypothetical protein Zmor_013501 [Zophobas morio]|uniref:Uncharacterized protein n=1 Tax=Zophobas morio TaxID=2755281 RepID=A0AA38MEQ3_9CUCU|nr:hypothetical protein Zmor_013501 [Zophobas morio]